MAKNSTIVTETNNAGKGNSGTKPNKTAPVMSMALVSDTGSSSNDGITSNPAITGTGQANTLVTIRVADGTVLGAVMTDSTGTWSFTSTELTDGVHTLIATQTNPAGNTGTATLSFTLDRAAPTMSITLVSDTGSSSNDGITSNPAITGTGEANTLVTIRAANGTVLGMTTADYSGAWSFIPTGLADGVHTLTASQTDLAGNAGTATLGFTLEDIAAPSPAPSPIKAQLGKQTLEVNYGKATLETFTYRPSGEIKGVLLVFHGSARNADAARNAAMKVADTYGLYVVAPKFPDDEYSSKEYQMGGMISNGELLPEDDWTISLADDIALWAHEQVGNDRTDETIAYGHSAGGQFASRMAAFGPDIFDKIIVTNPSTHVRASLTEDMPYGFDGYMSSAQEKAYLMDYLADPVSIYLGSEDNDPNADDLATSAAAMRQGDDRLERGLFVYNEAKQLAESQGWDFNWELVIADGVGHTSSGMLNSPEFQEAFDGRYGGSSIDWFA
jgi:poly(3-hydroxybutyrate) depolymerase